MQPSPIAVTSKLLSPSLRFCICCTPVFELDVGANLRHMGVCVDSPPHSAPCKIYIDFVACLHETLGRMTRRLAGLFLALGVGCVLSVAAVPESSDPVEAIKSYSDFTEIDLGRVLNGDILSERGSLMNFPNGISVQTLYAMALPADEAARHLQLFDPSPYSELKVFAFHAVHAPAEPADFQPLDFQSRERPVRWLLDKTVATTPTRSELNLSRDEAQ